MKQRAVEVGAMVKDGVSNAMEQFKAWQAEKLHQAQQQEKALERQRQVELAKIKEHKQEQKQEKKIDRGYDLGR